MKKRIFAMLVAAILLMGAFAVNVSAEATTAIEEWNIVLGDQIGANFYVNVPENTANAAVKVTVADQTETHELTAPNSKGLYKVSVNVAAAQMTEEITLQLVADGTEYAPVSYSIREYADHILKGNYSDDVKTMVKYMLNYGAAAQTYFGVQTENLANAGYKMDYTAQYPAEYPKLAVEGQLDGVRLYGASLVMDSKVAVRYYFVADSVEGVTFSANGKEYAAAEKNDMFCVEIPGILPQQYGNSIVLSAQKGEEKLDVTYSPLTYMVRMSQKGSEEMKALVNAMYGYYEAAVAYTDSAVFSVVSGNWDLSNQYNGSLTVLKQKDGTTVKTNADNYRGVSVKVKEYTPSLNDDGSLKKGTFSMQVTMIFDDSKYFEVRLHNTDNDGKYKLQNMGSTNNLGGSGWTRWATLTDAQQEKLINGDGVEFAVRLVGGSAEMWVDGTRMAAVALGDAYNGKLAQVKLCMNGNKGVKNMVIPYELTTPTAPVQLTLPTVTGGTVTVDSGYQVGDTIPVTVKPDEGYSQKLYINGKPLMVDWKSNTSTFVATEESYSITGSFEPSLDASGTGRWDNANQAHGILNAYYPSNNDTWRMAINGEYKSLAIMVKNYMDQADTMEGSTYGGFSAAVGVTMDTGNRYTFRIINKNVNGEAQYQYSRFGNDGLAGWGGKCVLDDKVPGATDLINGSGAEFKVARIGANVLQLTLNGVILDTYTMDGITADNKITAVNIYHFGNTGEKIEVPFELKTPADTPDVQLTIGETTNGTVTAQHAAYQVGDTIVLTIAPDEGYSQKLYINGEPMLCSNNSYSFVATEEVYNITGSFESDLFSATSGNWDLGNQQHGSLTITNKKSDATTVITNANNYKEVAVTVKDYTPSLNEDGSLAQGDFSMQVKMIFDDGKYYEVRLHNTDANMPNYKLQTVGGTNSITGTGWPWLADLTAAQKAKLLDGDGVEFAVKLVGPNAELWVDGSRMKVVELGAEYEGKLAQISLCMNGNKNGQNIVIPFELKVPEEAPTVQFNIPELANGTVTPGYDAYKVGETVTLAVAANAGYSQKLYINGEPLMLDWQSNTCSFVATEAVYNITGSFEPSITFTSISKWNIGNQAHGVLDTYYASKDSGWLGIEGGYDSITVTAKNYLLGDDGTGANGFAVMLGFKMSNGKTYTFRIVKQDGVYYCQRAGFAKPDGKEDWTKKQLDEAAIAAINGDGVEFKVERTAANVLTISVNGIVYDTYTMADTTEEVTVTKGYIGHYGNLSQDIQIPFTLQ